MSDWFEDGNLTVDYRGCRVWLDSREIHISALRFRILQYITENAGKSLSPRDILRHAWLDEQYDVGLVRWHIARLRRDLKDATHDRIVHVRGFGYRYDRTTPQATTSRNSRFRPQHSVSSIESYESIHRCSARSRSRTRQSRLRPVVVS